MGSLSFWDTHYGDDGYHDNFNSELPYSGVLRPQDSGSGSGISQDASSHISHPGFVDSPSTLSYNNPDILYSNQTASYSDCSELSPGAGGDSGEAPDFSDACIKYLSDIMMDESLQQKPSTVQEFEALRATEKVLYDAIGQTYSPPTDQFPPLLDQHAEISCGEVFNASSGSAPGENTTYPLAWTPPGGSLLESTSPSSGSTGGTDDHEGGLDESTLGSPLDLQIPSGNFQWIEKALANFIGMGNSDFDGLINQESNVQIHQMSTSRPEESGNVAAPTLKGSRIRKNHPRDDTDSYDTRNNKHLEVYTEDDVMEQFDDILLQCKTGTEAISLREQESLPQSDDSGGRIPRSERSKGSKSRSSRGKNKSSSVEDVVDLNALLIQCAQAVASFDLRSAHELLKRIRQHSSSCGDGIQRVSHYFADGLESRMAGTASQKYNDISNWNISASHFMKAYRSYVKAVPFKRMSFYVANKTIGKLSAEAKKIHIIDFGVLFGIQWPCLIQNFSQRKNGPPMLRITGVDFPQKGYQPAARVEESTRRLGAYCKRFGVPFESHYIAQNWDTLQPEDFNIQKDEFLVVNCLYRSRILLDDTVTVEVDSPRDAFLKLIRKLKPDLFIHGIINGTHNAPFFTTRFREAMFFFSSVFDVFDATMPRDNEDRQLIERELYGKDILNIVASEGAERVERPETYKQWQMRNQRAGFRKVPLDRDIVSTAKAIVKANYHKDFVVDEDNNWLLQGWKGRVLSALSCWKPV